MHIAKRFRALSQKLEADHRWASLLQFAKFGLVGLSNTLISLGVYWFCLFILHWYYQIANLVSFLVSVSNSYFWNSRYVFRCVSGYKLRQHLSAFIKTVAAYGTTFFINTLLVTLLVEFVRISEGVAPLLCMPLTIPANFLLNKYWAFKDRRIGHRDIAQNNSSAPSP